MTDLVKLKSLLEKAIALIEPGEAPEKKSAKPSKPATASRKINLAPLESLSVKRASSIPIAALRKVATEANLKHDGVEDEKFRNTMLAIATIYAGERPNAHHLKGVFGMCGSAMERTWSGDVLVAQACAALGIQLEDAEEATEEEAEEAAEEEATEEEATEEASEEEEEASEEEAEEEEEAAEEEAEEEEAAEEETVEAIDNDAEAVVEANWSEVSSKDKWGLVKSFCGNYSKFRKEETTYTDPVMKDARIVAVKSYLAGTVIPKSSVLDPAFTAIAARFVPYDGQVGDFAETIKTPYIGLVDGQPRFMFGGFPILSIDENNAELGRSPLCDFKFRCKEEGVSIIVPKKPAAPATKPAVGKPAGAKPVIKKK